MRRRVGAWWLRFRLRCLLLWLRWRAARGWLGWVCYQRGSRTFLVPPEGLGDPVELSLPAVERLARVQRGYNEALVALLAEERARALA